MPEVRLKPDVAQRLAIKAAVLSSRARAVESLEAIAREQRQDVQRDAKALAEMCELLGIPADKPSAIGDTAGDDGLVPVTWEGDDE